MIKILSLAFSCTITLHRGRRVYSMKQMYSYIRWSSDRQEMGTSLQRQLAGAREFATHQGLELVEVIEAGVSAFKGKNTEDGKLGDFIAAVEAGVIPSDSWLYVENLDRLTRQDVTTAQELFLKLLRLGLTIVTGMDKRIYTSESVNKNPTDLMLSILLFSRANEESKTKQTRTIGNVEALIERHNNGEPVNIKSAGRHPFWIDDSGSQYEKVKKHPELWPIAREAIEMFLEGHGIYKVKRYLDEKYPNALRGKEWDYQVLKKLRENRALIGERTINVGGNERKLDNYFPKLCKSEIEFLKLQELREQNAHKSKRDPNKENIKLLSGLSLLRCARCGGTLHGYAHKGKSRYTCTNGKHLQKDCIAWSVTAPIVDQCVITSLLMGYFDVSRVEEQNTSDIEEVIKEKQELINDLDSKISNIVSVIEQGVSVPELAGRLKILNENRKELLLEVARLSERKAVLDSKGSFEVTMIDFMELIHYERFNNLADESRNKIREVISSIIESIYINKEDGCISIHVRCRGSDNWFVFKGVDRKPKWKFDVVYTTSNDNPYAVDDKTDLELNERLKSAIKEHPIVEKTIEYKKAYLEFFKTASDMLTVVGYPDIDGSMFWPNR